MFRITRATGLTGNPVIAGHISRQLRAAHARSLPLLRIHARTLVRLTGRGPTTKGKALHDGVSAGIAVINAFADMASLLPGI